MAKKNNAAKKRADQRRKARVEAREHFREEHGEKGNGKVHIQNAAKLAEVMKGLSDKINEAKAKRDSEIGVPVSESDNTSGQLPKPDWQGQDKTGNGEFIYWRWDIVNDQASVNAHYYLTDSDDGRFTKGDFIVTVRMVANEEIFSAEESRRFGEALISAYAWKQVWRNFTGEYIANGGWSNEVLEAAARLDEVKNEIEAENNRIEAENNAVADMDREHLHRHDDGMIGTSPNCPGGVDLPEPKAESNEEVSEDDYKNFEPFVHSCCEHCEIDKDIHAPHTEGCPND